MASFFSSSNKSAGIILCGGLSVILVSLIIAAAYRSQDADKQGAVIPELRSNEGLERIVNSHKMAEEPKILLGEEILERSLTDKPGDAHSHAMEFIIDCIKKRVELLPETQEAIITYLSSPKPSSIESGLWHERVNELFNLLRAQPDEVPGFSELLVHMSSSDPDPVLRMYALQHISLWIPKEPVKANKAEMIEFLEKLAADEMNPLSGSAIMFLCDLNRKGSIPERIESTEIIESSALRIIADNNSRADVRICALHVSAERKLVKAAVDSRHIAQDSSLMVPLRKAAIYTLGEIGTTEDIEFLESLAVSSDVLNAATTPAIKRINVRNKTF